MERKLLKCSQLLRVGRAITATSARLRILPQYEPLVVLSGIFFGPELLSEGHSEVLQTWEES